MPSPSDTALSSSGLVRNNPTDHHSSVPETGESFSSFFRRASLAGVSEKGRRGHTPPVYSVQFKGSRGISGLLYYSKW